MTGSLRVIIAHDDTEHLDDLHSTLNSLGHDVVASATTSQELAGLCKTCLPDLVVSATSLPGMNSIDAIHLVQLQHDAPVILIGEGKSDATQLGDSYTLHEMEQAIEEAFLRTPHSMRRSEQACHWFG